MCGIAGILAADAGSVDHDALGRMIAALHHRGPDERAVRVDGRVGLASARLSVIDIDGGHQPMSSEDGAVRVVFNGEIFNYVALREELIRKGHTFRTRSDTEVLVHLYEEEREHFVQRLNGQWAFALWDSREQVLMLSRDRLGVRPLFYTRATGALLFASEVKALFQHPGVSRELDPLGLDNVFTFWTTLAPRTVFKDVRELPPGHTLLSRAGAITVRRFWQAEFGDDASPVSERDSAEQLRAHLLEATRLRLQSDAPVAAYLSGGLDSSVIAALIKKTGAVPLRTFSVTFDDSDFDEQPYQREVASFLGSTHEEVRCSDRDIADVFPDVVWHAEAPLIRTAPAPLFLLSRRVRERGYKVVLTGEGADEILGGYDIFKEAKIRRFWARRPDSKVRPLLLGRLYPYLRDLRRQSPAYLQAFFHVTAADLASPLFSHMPRWELTSRAKLFWSDAMRAAVGSYDGTRELAGGLPSQFSAWDPFSQSQYLELAHLLPGYILSSQGDRMAMANSVEGRFPFLDCNVVAFAGRLSPRLKMKVLDEKHLLKQVARDLVPDAVRRRTKQPYRAPEGKVFFARRGGYVDDLLSPAQIGHDGVFKPAPVEQLVRKFREGRAIGIKDNMALVAILSTQLLVDRFVNNFGRAEHDPTYAGITAVRHR